MMRYGYYAGLLIPFWLTVGVATAGALYPGYSHIDRAMSELGALGAPTQTLSPLLNNYPLALLFALFGAAVCATFARPRRAAMAVPADVAGPYPGYSKLAWFTGALIVLHGVGSFGTGYFSCDVGCRPEHPSMAQQWHSIAGLVMALSLLLAGALWIPLAKRLFGSRRFAVLSLLCTLLQVVTLLLMARAALHTGADFGLYQRLNYGAAVVWGAGLAWMLSARQRRA